MYMFAKLFFSEVKLVEIHYNTKKLKWWPCQTKRTLKIKWLAETNPIVCVIEKNCLFIMEITNNVMPVSKWQFINQ